MANIKITDLNAYTDPDSTDVLPIVDVTSDETKKVSIADLLENAGSGAEATPGIAFDGDSDTGIYRPGANQIAISTAGTKRLEISATGAVTIPGDLTVQGTTTFIDSTTLRVEDKNIELGYVGTPTDTTADGGGITLKGATDKTINWINATDAWTSSERFDFPAGTAAAPSVILNGDVNTGLYQPGADQVAISTGGTGRLFIDSSGRLGVGTSAPGALLDVYLGNNVAGTIARFGGYNDGRSLVFSNTGIGNDHYINAQGGAGTITFQTASTDRVRIDSSGRVGVGTSSPSTRLHVLQDTNAPQLRIESTSSGNRAQGTFINAHSQWELGVSGGTTGKFIIATSTENVDLGIYTRETGQAQSEKVTITSAGNVGIGNTSPDDYLTIANTSTSGDIGLRFKGDASSRQFIMFGDPGGNQLGDIMYDHGTNAMRFRVNNTERLRIDSSGRLGVGTSSPAEKLQVGSGGSGAQWLRVFGSTSDIYIGQTNGNIFGFGNGNGQFVYATAAEPFGIGTSGTQPVVFGTNAVERVRIDSSGRLLVGTASASTADKLIVQGNASSSTGAAVLGLQVGTTTVSAGVDLGYLNYCDSSGNRGAWILGEGDGTWTSGSSHPTRLVFSTTASGASSPTERLRIDSSGRVGIGITPSAKLDVSSTSGTLFRCEDSGVAQLNIGNGGNSINYYDADTQIFRSGGGSERARIDSSGRLGLGTSSLNTKLDVAGSSAAYTTAPAITFTDTGSGQGTANRWMAGNIAVVNYGDFALAVAPDTTSTTFSPKIVVTEAGNVGIGTTSPTFPLQVETTATGTTAGSNGVILVQSQASGRDAHIRFGDSVNSTARVGYLSNSLYAYVNGQERLRINSSGVLTAGNSNATTGQTIIDGWYNGDNKLNVFGSQHSSGGTVLAFAARPKGGAAGYVSSVGIASFARSAIELDGDGFKFKTGPSSTTAIGTDVTLSERVRIDNSGRVGVGTTSPGSYAGDANKFVIANTSGGAGLTIATNTTSYGRIFFADGTSGNAAYRGVIQYNHSNDSMELKTADSRAVWIDSSQRVGIGSAVTPDSYLHVWGGVGKPGMRIGYSDNSNYFDSDYFIVRNTAGTERMRVDSSGRVGIGTSSPGTDLDVNSSSANCVIRGRTGSGYSSSLNLLPNGSGSGLELKANSDSSAKLINQLNSYLGFGTNNTERMRIGSTGETELYTNASFNLRTNRTSGLTAALNVYKGATSISTGTLVCQIRADGDLLNTNNSYGALSDVKLKENIVDANSQWDDLKAIQVRNYNFKEGQTHTQLGVVAQEVELVSPGLVRDTPDTDKDGNDLGTTTKSVNYSVLYMKAVKALQEAMERIETLEAKVAALEGN